LGVVEVSVVDTHYGVSQPEQTLSGRGARVYKIIQGPETNTRLHIYTNVSTPENLVKIGVM